MTNATDGKAVQNAAEIHQAIRAALGHERAAAGHEDKYEQQMRSAGASMYAAFALAAKSQPEYQGRKLDEKAIARLYKGTAPRKWWDEHLAAAKVVDGKGKADRDRAKRLIQWHVDPDGAAARRVQRAQQKVSQRRQSVSAARGPRVAPESHVTPVMQQLAAAGEAPTVTLEDLLGEVSRLQSAARKVEEAHRADALEAVKNAAREVERYVP